MSFIVPVEDDVTAGYVDICFFDGKVPKVIELLKVGLGEF